MNENENKNIKKRDDFEEEDIFYIVKKMYNFEFVNKNEYKLDIEKEKLKLKTKIDKLTTYPKYRKEKLSKNNVHTMEEIDKRSNKENNNDTENKDNIDENDKDKINDKNGENEKMPNNNNTNEEKNRNENGDKNENKEKNEIEKISLIKSDEPIGKNNEIAKKELIRNNEPIENEYQIVNNDSTENNKLIQKNELINKNEQTVNNQIENNDIIEKNKKNTENIINEGGSECTCTQEDIDYIIKLMKNKEYRIYFLTKINNFRALGSFIMPEKVFNYLIQIFKEISKYLCIEGKNEEKKEMNLDMEVTRLIIILSQTFCKMKGNKKVYIQNQLKDIDIFHCNEFWKTLIKINIEKQIEICKKNEKEIGKEENEESIKSRRNNICFAQIIPQITGMNGFGLGKEKIKNIIIPFIDKYNVTEENKNIILNFIDSPN